MSPMLGIFTFLCAYLTVLVSQTNAQSCPPDYTWLNTFSSCVKAYSHGFDQSDAEFMCGFWQGHLLSVHSVFQRTELSDYLYKHSPYIWLGLKEDKTGQYTWSDGTHYDYHNWASGQPSGAAECTAMSTTGAFSGDWFNRNCTEIHGFVCEANTVTSTVGPTTVPPGSRCPQGWAKFDTTNACYKVFKVAGYGEGFCNLFTSDDGKMAHSVSIHSAAENHFIAKLAAETDSYHDNPVYLSLGLYYSSSRWQWYDGTPFDYNNWASGEPASSAYYSYIAAGQPDTWHSQSSSSRSYFHPVCKIQLQH